MKQTTLSGNPAPPRTAARRTIDMALLEEQLERLKSRMRVAVIFGGNKSIPDSVVYRSHNTRSWKSYEVVAQDIADALRRRGFRYVELMPDDMRLGDRLCRQGIHMAWLNTGGMQGYNPAAHASAMLEMMGVPYIGHDPLAASMLDNKHAFKRIAAAAGIPTPPFTVWHMERGPFRPDLNSRFKRTFADYAGPFVVKPVCGRASLHVHVVADLAGLPEMIAEVYRVTENAVLIEQFMPGREVCIAVSGPIIAPRGRLVRSARPFTFAALERALTADEQIFTSMDRRPITQDRLRPLDCDRDASLLAEMRRLAHETYLEFNLGSLIRLDLRADEHGSLFILEANPKPDLKKPGQDVTSLIGAGLAEVGMDYDDLILSLLADRLDFLSTHRPAVLQHIFELMNVPNLFDLMDLPASQGLGMGLEQSAVSLQTSELTVLTAEIATDVSVMALNATLRTAKGHDEGADQDAPARPASPRGRMLPNSRIPRTA